MILLVELFVGLQLWAQARFTPVNLETIKTRLDLNQGDDAAREAALLKIFADAGCSASNLSEQVVPKRKERNIICMLPGETADIILVGAHFDHVPEGKGIIDNWSGASLLPSLFQALAAYKQRHTFVFIGFMGEELGEVGSSFYVSQLSKSDLSRISLMITIDSIGLGPTKVWASRVDRTALNLLGSTAAALKLPIAGVNVDGYGESDEEPFIRRKVKTITIHSLTNQNARVLHSKLDAPEAISLHDYYDTYHLLTGYLAVLDWKLDTETGTSISQPHQ